MLSRFSIGPQFAPPFLLAVVLAFFSLIWFSLVFLPPDLYKSVALIIYGAFATLFAQIFTFWQSKSFDRYLDSFSEDMEEAPA